MIEQSSAAMKLTTVMLMPSASGMVTSISVNVWTDSQAMESHALIAVIVCLVSSIPRLISSFP